jgi:hypothetical protein
MKKAAVEKKANLRPSSNTGSKGKKGRIEYDEAIMYKKYLKYKQKYIDLKKMYDII